MAAGHHATRALEAYREASHRDFYLHAGTALELAIKARLVGEHGVHCIAPSTAKWFDLSLAIARDIDGATQQRPHTVEASEAVRRLRLLEPTLPDVFGGHVSETLDRRNIAAHAGYGAAPSPEAFLSHAAAFVRALEMLLRSEPAVFWGDLAGLAQSLVAKELSAVNVRVQTRLAQARSKLRGLRDESREGTVEAIAAAVARDLEDEGPGVVGVPCPVCGFDGWGRGAVIDDGSAEVEYEDGGEIWHWVPDLFLLLDDFECQVCWLRLEGQEELTEASVPLKVPTDRARPSDAYDAIETNEAYYLS